ncbi:MAG: VOC family protein [Burkholderiales bacterium]|jgi:catechol 2,3-dioxygenase-like lactoylglutathione lyase family enzyme
MIKSMDHLVLTTRDAEKCIDFYTRVLGMKLESFGEGRRALRFGEQKINIHDKGTVTDGYAAYPTPGSLDICFLADRPLDEVIAQLRAADIPIELGPVARTGARFALRSVYVRDPDRNLIEISEPAR